MESPTPDKPAPQTTGTRASLDEILAREYTVDFENWFRKGFELFKAEGGWFVGFLFVLLLAYALAGSLPFVGRFSSIFVGPLVAGMFLVAARLDKHIPCEFATFFGIRDHYRELVLIVLVQSLVTYVLTLVVMGWGNFLVYMGWRHVDFSDFGTMMQFYSSQGKRYVLVWLPMLLLFTIWIFAPCFVLFRGYKAWDAMEASRKLVSKKLISWLGFVVLVGLFNAAGLICLVVGLLVTVPTSMCAVYVAFDEVVGVELHPGT